MCVDSKHESRCKKETVGAMIKLPSIYEGAGDDGGDLGRRVLWMIGPRSLVASLGTATEVRGHSHPLSAAYNRPRLSPHFWPLACPCGNRSGYLIGSGRASQRLISEDRQVGSRYLGS